MSRPSSVTLLFAAAAAAPPGECYFVALYRVVGTGLGAVAKALGRRVPETPSASAYFLAAAFGPLRRYAALSVEAHPCMRG